MSRISYFQLEEELAEIFRADTTLDGVKVEVEDELLFAADMQPWVGIYLDRRDAPEGIQQLRAGTSTRMRLRFSIWCWAYALDSVSDAIRTRDDLLGKVEDVLMRNRTIGDLVSMAWLEGGEMPSARLPDRTGFVSGAEIVLVADVTATTD